MAKVHVGGRSLTLDDVLDVSFSGAAVIVDEASLEKLRVTARNARAGGAVALPAALSRPGVPVVRLSVAATRATLVVVLNQLLLGRTAVRAEVAECLAALLNRGAAVPDVGAEVFGTSLAGALGIALARAVSGAGGWLDAATGASGSAAPSGIEWPHASAVDVVALSSVEGAAAIALGALGTAGASALICTADAVAALSAAALNVQVVDALSADMNDSVRALPGQTASATNMRLLLEGGSAATKRVMQDALDACLSTGLRHAFRESHITHGAASSAISAAARIAAIELNSALPAALAVVEKGKGIIEAGAAIAEGKAWDELAQVRPNFASLERALSNAGDAVEALALRSSERAIVPTAVPLLISASADEKARVDVGEALVRARAVILEGLASRLAGKAESSCAGSPSTPSGCATVALNLLTAVHNCTLLLGFEVAAGESLLSVCEEEAVRAGEAREKSKAAAAAAREEAEAARIAALSPEARAEWEAKEAKRREKSAKRDAGGAAAASGTPAVPAAAANPLGLPPGVAEFRALVNTTAATARAPALLAGLPLDSSPPAALSPFLIPAASRVGPALRRLLERIASGGEKRKPKIAKGARDYAGGAMIVRERVFNTLRTVFKRHGA